LSSETARIGILCPGYGTIPRGVETFIGELVPRLRQLRPGWTFDIYCRAASRNVGSGMKVVHVPAIDRNGSAATLYARLAHRLRLFLRTRIDAECLSFTVAAAPRLLRARYDLIFNQAGPFAGQLLRLKRRTDGTPFVHKTASGHGRLELIMARQQPDAIVATSPYVKDWLEKRISKLQIEYIPNAVDCTTFRPYSKEELEAARNGLAILELNRPVILFVGAMDPMKRPHLLISAASTIPEVSLVMVGSGRLAESIRKLGVEKFGADRFLHIARASREQMAIYYNACDLFTLPSEEPFGIAFLEAMACDKPVVGHDSPVQRWIFGEAGLTCDCTNPEEYGRTIRRALDSDLRGRARERGREFDWPEIARRYESLLSRVASRGHRDRASGGASG